MPGFTYRDLFEKSWTVRADSDDGGRTWTKPDRILVEEGGQARETLCAMGYGDGDIVVGFFRSEDALHWTQVSEIINGYDDAPSEAELQFFGAVRIEGETLPEPVERCS